MKGTATRLPLVSVIIPAYNEGSLLALAIRSVLSQDYPHTEIVVVNDGSTSSETRDTALAFGEKVVYIERENGGVAAARNTGIQAANGELIALLDQDDIWLPHKLSTQVQALLSYPRVGLIHSSYYLIGPTGERTGVARLPEREWKPLPSMLIEATVAPCTVLIPRTVLDRVGPFDPTLTGSDDWDMWLRMAAAGYAFYCLGVPLAEYRVHPANTSRNIDLMVRAGVGVLDKFYSQPDLPVEAARYRGLAYGTRYAWAAAAYYGADRLSEAENHVLRAARLYPSAITSGRFLQSLVYSRPEGPSQAVAEEAVRFVEKTLRRADLPAGALRKLQAYSRLVLATHKQGDRTAQLAALAGAALGSSVLATDPALWCSGGRAFLNAVSRVWRRFSRAFVDIIDGNEHQI